MCGLISSSAWPFFVSFGAIVMIWVLLKLPETQHPEDRKPIEGLYAAGNNSGNFFGGVYQKMSTPGMSVGRAFLTGRVAAWRACGITD